MNVVPPGSTIGILGSGQLGRMLAIEARRLGYRVYVFSPDRETPAGALADREFTADYEDVDAVAAFAREVHVVTFEFENVSAASAGAARLHSIVRPAGEILQIAQHRIDEKTFLESADAPVGSFRPLVTDEDLRDATNAWRGPAVLKTATLGYDGKGQRKVMRSSDLADAWNELGGVECILEDLIDFDKEVSVVIARGIDGVTADYGVIENRHVNHILDVSFAPAAISEATRREAREVAHRVAEALQLVGLMCIEMFVLRDGSILVNEIAPRPHNSGHLTIEGSVTNQFEQQIRAVCGLPLGSTRFHSPVAMANLLGDLWENGTPDWSPALAVEGVKLHLYGKAHAKPGRKMGHLTAVADSADDALRAVLEARRSLKS